MAEIADSTRYLGVSQPISTAGPDEKELKLTEELYECLKSFNLFETEKELQERIEVLRKVNSLVKKWVRQVSEETMPPESCASVGGKLFTFGSYRLGVHNRGADIDSLCVVPRHVTREHFFTSFYELLKQDPEVSELHAVPDAYVPVMKLRYSTIELDVLFARLALREVPDSQTLDDDAILKNLDEKSVRSLNGCRVADEILRAVPNQESFTLFLRAIKLWAKNRGIYSNALGFLGGISWAILVARTCQLYPNVSAAKLISKFFFVFSNWAWPSPVFIKESVPKLDCPNLMNLVWDPRQKTSDRYHLMPIITPAFPEQNSTFNVSQSTRTILLNELKDGLEITMEIAEGKSTWIKLFEEVNFFSRYKHFISLLCAAPTEDEALVFSGFIESKIRFLIGFLERKPEIVIAHINPKQYKPKPSAKFEIPYKNPICTLWFIGVEFDRQLAKNVDLTIEIANFHQQIEQLKASPATKTKYTDKMLIELKYVRRKELVHYLKKEDLKKGRDIKERAPKLARTLSENTSKNSLIESESNTSLQNAIIATEEVSTEEKQPSTTTSPSHESIKVSHTEESSIEIINTTADSVSPEKSEVNFQLGDVDNSPKRKRVIDENEIGVVATKVTRMEETMVTDGNIEYEHKTIVTESVVRIENEDLIKDTTENLIEESSVKPIKTTT